LFTSFQREAAIANEFARKFKPGLLSDELREALGIGTLEPPPYLNKIARWGYPPAYTCPDKSGTIQSIRNGRGKVAHNGSSNDGIGDTGNGVEANVQNEAEKNDDEDDIEVQSGPVVSRQNCANYSVF
jgi:hypothetical protein